MSSIHEAIASGKPKKVQQILESDPSQIHQLDSTGDTPLHRAVSFGLKSIVQTLLKYGADVNASGAFDNRPLHYVSSPDLDPDLGAEMAELLLRHGANPELKNEYDESSLLLAAMKAPGVADVILRHGAFVDLNSAVFLSRVDRIRELLRDEPRIQQAPFPGQLLAAAVYRQDKEIVRLLLKHGANPNHGMSPLLAAVEVALNQSDTLSLEILELLIEFGADVSTTNDGVDLTRLLTKHNNQRAETILALLKKLGGSETQRIVGKL